MPERHAFSRRDKQRDRKRDIDAVMHARQTDVHSAGEVNRGTGKETYNQVCSRNRDREPYAITARQPTKLTAMQLDSQIAIK